MAPQLSPLAQVEHFRRQGPSATSAVTSPSASAGGPAPVPTAPSGSLECGMACIRLGDTSDCNTDQSQACLCKSGRYIASVNTCLTSRCTPADAQTGAEYSYGACLFLGVNVSTIAVPEPTKGVDITTAPQVYNRAFFNVQAVMSSICSALLLLALILGFFSCRARARLDTQTQQGSWVNMGTTASRSQAANGGKSFGGVSRGFDPTATFASASYPQPAKRATGMGMERSRGFTNRLTLDEEEWEMGDTLPRAGPRSPGFRSSGRGMGRVKEGSPSGSGHGSASSFVSSGGKEDMDLKAKDGEISPMTFTTTGRSRANSDVELEGSTIHLATLSRGNGGYGRAI